MDDNMKRVLLVLFLFSFSFCNSFAQKEEIETVKIGKQVWMAKNLDVVVFRNGDTIPEIRSDSAWTIAVDSGKPAWCYYKFDVNNGKKYGKLYNWLAVNDPRGLAPQGYHVPTDAEWIVLEKFLGYGAGSKLKSTNGWHFDGNGTNKSGFTGLPAGKRWKDGEFDDMGEESNWWTSTAFSNTTVISRRLDYFNHNLIRDSRYKDNGFSVRCIKD
jgi:uncharacterized protein (TIGR02145 family)